MKTIRTKPGAFLGHTVALGIAMLPVVAASQTITYVDLHPPGATQSVAYATSEFQQVGQIDGRAAMWASTANSATFLGGPGSRAIDLSGNRQVGEYRYATKQGTFLEGGTWSGTPDSWIPLPHVDANNGFRTAAAAISGDLVVGWDYSFAGSALFWNLVAGTVTDLRPPGVFGATAFNIHGNQQVGWIYLGLAQPFHAAVWNGTAESFVNLHPPGARTSRANATSGGLQGGEALFGSQTHAVLWHGTAESVLDVHPVGAEHSAIFDAAGEWQAGYASFAGQDHAGLWRGSAESFLDLHPVLDPLVYSSSRAWRMWTDGRIIKIAGLATHVATGYSHAILWTITLPDEQPPVIVEAAASPAALWPPNNKLICVNLDALVTDDSGDAEWSVVDIECNENCPDSDMQIVDDHTVKLRATRSGNGTGRVYTLWLQAQDAAGTVSEPYPVAVTVPHDRADKP